jgi:riboflavin kinase/FMN adenylyltransferase
VKVLVGLDALSPPAEGAAVTIGTFDGVHLGHRALISQTIEDAERTGTSSVAVTWDRHPNATLRPDRTPPLLASPERKIELLETTEIGLLAVIPFDRELSQWPPERFVEDVLVGGLGVKSIFVGHDWRFGHKAKGDVALLTRLGQTLGFEVHGARLAEVGDEPVSSSRTRRAVEDGDMEEARALLGRPFDVDGLVVHGDHRGKGLGYPTANLEVDAALARPPMGVYAGKAHVDGVPKVAAINVGVNPTFGGDTATEEPGTTPHRIEAYLLDHQGDLYGRVIRVEFWKRLRDELKFDSVDDLVAQMGRDVEETRGLITL